jgi:hypothetical protein
MRTLDVRASPPEGAKVWKLVESMPDGGVVFPTFALDREGDLWVCMDGGAWVQSRELLDRALSVPSERNPV